MPSKSTPASRVEFPPLWPHPHLIPRSDAEARALMRVRPADVVFVFGSNLVGRHIGGAARIAERHFGAVMGVGTGLQGQSFAIPTMGRALETLSLAEIAPWVRHFLSASDAMPAKTFYVTAVGTGIAGLAHEDIAPLFAERAANVLLPPEWLSLVDVAVGQ